MFTHDLKFGLRMLLRKPLLTIGISLSLALGIGANSAVFSLVDAVLFKPLNVGNPSRLVSVYIVVALMLIAIAMLACFMPAYKATKVDPSDALRHE